MKVLLYSFQGTWEVLMLLQRPVSWSQASPRPSPGQTMDWSSTSPKMLCQLAWKNVDSSSRWAYLASLHSPKTRPLWVLSIGWIVSPDESSYSLLLWKCNTVSSPLIYQGLVLSMQSAPRGPSPTNSTLWREESFPVKVLMAVWSSITSLCWD